MEGDNEHIDPTELEEGLLQDVQAAARRYKEAAAALEAAQDELKAAGENLKATAEAGDQALNGYWTPEDITEASYPPTAQRLFDAISSIQEANPDLFRDLG